MVKQHLINVSSLLPIAIYLHYYVSHVHVKDKTEMNKFYLNFMITVITKRNNETHSFPHTWDE